MSQLTQLAFEFDEMKRCHSCDEWKPLTQFRKQLRNRGGLSHQCNRCLSAYNRSRRAGAPRQHKRHDPARALFADGLHRCAKCRAVKHLSLFDRSTTNPFGVQCRCRSCKHQDSMLRRPVEQKRHQQRYVREREDFIARVRAWYWANRDRARRQHLLRSNAQTPEERQQIAERKRRWAQANPLKIKAYSTRRRTRRRAGGTYLLTERDVAAMLVRQDSCCAYCGVRLTNFHIDHRIPLARGGTNNPDNLCIACPRCNCSKRARTPDEFMVYLAFVKEALRIAAP